MGASAYVLTQLGFLLQLLVAGICGAVIGYERKSRLKEAGMRTHVIVALGAALMTLVSKYGFTDVLQLRGYGLDPSRVAAQIVSGIGFLGAGMIFVRKQSVKGLTTAAGIWTTAGVGMAIGAGLYWIGIAATGLVLLVQILLHKNFRWLPAPPVSKRICVEFSESGGAVEYLRRKFSEYGIDVIGLRIGRKESGGLEIDLFVRLPASFDPAVLMTLTEENPRITSIEI